MFGAAILGTTPFAGFNSGIFGAGLTPDGQLTLLIGSAVQVLPAAIARQTLPAATAKQLGPLPRAQGL